jgi:hypothetical protein
MVSLRLLLLILANKSSSIFPNYYHNINSIPVVRTCPENMEILFSQKSGEAGCAQAGG